MLPLVLHLQEAAEESASEEEEEEAEEGDGEQLVKEAADAKVAVDNGDDALLLLRALAAHDNDVKQQLAGQSEILGTRCVIM